MAAVWRLRSALRTAGADVGRASRRRWGPTSRRSSDGAQRPCPGVSTCRRPGAQGEEARPPTSSLAAGRGRGMLRALSFDSSPTGCIAPSSWSHTTALLKPSSMEEWTLSDPVGSGVRRAAPSSLGAGSLTTRAGVAQGNSEPFRGWPPRFSRSSVCAYSSDTYGSWFPRVSRSEIRRISILGVFLSRGRPPGSLTTPGIVVTGEQGLARRLGVEAAQERPGDGAVTGVVFGATRGRFRADCWLQVGSALVGPSGTTRSLGARRTACCPRRCSSSQSVMGASFARRGCRDPRAPGRPRACRAGRVYHT